MDQPRNLSPIEAWKHALDLQKHFNDILFRIRNLAFAFCGAAAVALLAGYERLPKGIAGWRWAGLAAPWLALYIIDRFYYHELLRASVRFAEEIEKRGEAPQLGMALTRGNRITLPGRFKVSLFYWLPLAGLTWAFGGWSWAWVTAVPFLGLELLATAAYWLRGR